MIASEEKVPSQEVPSAAAEVPAKLIKMKVCNLGTYDDSRKLEGIVKSFGVVCAKTQKKKVRSSVRCVCCRCTRSFALEVHAQNGWMRRAKNLILLNSFQGINWGFIWFSAEEDKKVALEKMQNKGIPGASHDRKVRLQEALEVYPMPVVIIHNFFESMPRMTGAQYTAAYTFIHQS